MPGLKLSVDAAYLPYVTYKGTDNHLARSYPFVIEETGTGAGAQVEASLSYAVTDDWSVGICGRYSTEWATGNGVMPDVDPVTNAPTGTKIKDTMRFTNEQATGFAQISYRFGTIYAPLK